MSADSPIAAVSSGVNDAAPRRDLPPAAAAAVQELFARSGAEQFGFGAADLADIVGGVVRRFVAADASAAEIADFVRSLRVEELALARACSAGNEKAWEVFLGRYREKLYDAAYAIARDESAGHELADSVYADLYGTTVRDGVRVGKLSSYSGRGSLEGWLRTVLAQEYVNRYRSNRRTVSLEEKAEAGEQFEAPAPAAMVEPDPRLSQATAEALGKVSPEDRLVLAAYYLDGRKLAEIGRMVGAHESTISRRMDKILAGLHKAVRSGLQARGMSRRQAQEALEADVRDLDLDVRKFLAQENQAKTFSSQGEVSRARAERPKDQ